MDASRLLEALDFLKADERSGELQQKLQAVLSALQSLTSSPGEAAYQTAFAEQLDALEKALQVQADTYNPSQLERIIALGAKPYFTTSLSSSIRRSISNNPVSPATTLAALQSTLAKRAGYLEHVDQVIAGLTFFGVGANDLEDNEAQVGFEIPRSIFDNDLAGFISELRVVLRIMRVMSEVKTGTTPDVKLGTISTTDPITFLQSTPAVVGYVGFLVSWCLNQWKKIEEIRKLRAETAKSQFYTSEELESFFDTRIKEILDNAVREKVDELLAGSPLKDHRKNELKSELSWSLESMFARIERGMKVEIRTSIESLPDESPDEDRQVNDALEEVRTIGLGLSFPKISSDPILSLPSVPDADPAPKPRRSRARKPPPE